MQRMEHEMKGERMLGIRFGEMFPKTLLALIRDDEWGKGVMGSAQCRVFVEATGMRHSLQLKWSKQTFLPAITSSCDAHLTPVHHNCGTPVGHSLSLALSFQEHVFPLLFLSSSSFFG
uniref:Uncharacterized protein n=1 Tax=Sphaerodactylus townsendi TaxID=933632 RepID=A0ACB8FEP3_9SAUR